MKMVGELDEATKSELERLELQLMDPAVRRNRERVAGLLTEDFLEFGSSGRVWTRETTLELLATETYSPPVVESFACRVLGRDVVLVTYRAVRTTGATDGRTVTLRSSIWTRKSGSWKICFHQGTRAS
jgi:hypothetical protein